MEEKIFLSEGGVTVTSARFVVSSQTYAMGGITSVKSYEERTRPAAVLGTLAILMGILLLFGGGGIAVAGIVGIFAGAFLLTIEKSTFYVVLNSASGEPRRL